MYELMCGHEILYGNIFKEEIMGRTSNACCLSNSPLYVVELAKDNELIIIQLGDLCLTRASFLIHTSSVFPYLSLIWSLSRRTCGLPGRRPAHSFIIVASLSKNYITGIVLEVAELAMLRE